MNHFNSITLLAALSLLSACSHPQPGPDKTLAGAVLGAGWGAGAGAVVGNQVSTSGTGAGVGAGIGLVSGAMQGAGYDVIEGQELHMQNELESLKIHNAASARQLALLQGNLDRAISTGAVGSIYQVLFDSDATNLRSGAISNLEVIADSLKRNPSAYVINVVGHSDDAGNPEHNARVSEARARTVASYLQARGISADQIVVKSFGSTRPVAANTTAEGRQLNRRVDVYIARAEPALARQNEPGVAHEE